MLFLRFHGHDEHVRVLSCVCLFISLSALCHSFVEKVTGSPTDSTKTVLPVVMKSLNYSPGNKNPSADCLDKQRKVGNT